MNLAVTKLVQTLGQAKLVHDFKYGRMYCIAAKVPVEIFMSF